MKISEFNRELEKQLEFEFYRHKNNGIYSMVQIELCYHSNRIEGSLLSKDHVISLFDTGTLTLESKKEILRLQDIQEASGHFLMLNHMIKTLKQPLSEELIQSFHYHLKAGVFVDQTNGYAIGAYKTRENRVGNRVTSPVKQVEGDMKSLLEEYHRKTNPSLKDLLDFHVRYETIHPFQDGNGRTGRLILFREALRNHIVPFVIRDHMKHTYYKCLINDQNGNHDAFQNYVHIEQKYFFENMKGYIFDYQKIKDISFEDLEDAKE